MGTKPETQKSAGKRKREAFRGKREIYQGNKWVYEGCVSNYRLFQ